MRIAIASGKGGAGKTMLAASLHTVWPRPHILVDADVEEPNLHLFVKPNILEKETVSLAVPTQVDESCTHCGDCRAICRYGAIACFDEKIALFPDMCHGCGGCFRVCKAHALQKGLRTLGIIERGELSDATPYFSGTTRVGEVMTPPVLRRLLACVEQSSSDLSDRDVLIDGPPGVSCPAVTVARRVDFVIIVVDPTPFGIADFSLAFEAFSLLGLPMACVLNRADMPGNSEGDAMVHSFCEKHALPLAGSVPFSKEGAAILAQGGMLPDALPLLRPRFVELAKTLSALAKKALEKRTSTKKHSGAGA